MAMVSSSERYTLSYIDFSRSDGSQNPNDWTDILLEIGCEPSLTYHRLTHSSNVQSLDLFLLQEHPIPYPPPPILYCSVFFIPPLFFNPQTVFSLSLVMLHPLCMYISFSATSLCGGYP